MIKVVDLLNNQDLMAMADTPPEFCKLDRPVLLKGWQTDTGKDRLTMPLDLLVESSFGDPLANLIHKEEQQGGTIATNQETTVMLVPHWHGRLVL